MNEDMVPLTRHDLQRYIDEQDIEATLLADIGDTPTVVAAAEVLGVVPDRVLKTLLVTIEPVREQTDGTPPDDTVRRYAVVISHGEHRIDKRTLSRFFQVGRKRVRMASAEVVLEYVGYPVGGVPPLGHRSKLPVFLDESILALDESEGGVVFAGGGDDSTMMRVTVGELLRVLEPTVMPLS